jgi:hypothetical protein
MTVLWNGEQYEVPLSGLFNDASWQPGQSRFTRDGRPAVILAIEPMGSLKPIVYRVGTQAFTANLQGITRPDIGATADDIV